MTRIKFFPVFSLLTFLFLASCEEEDIGPQVTITSVEPVSAQSGDTIFITGSGYKQAQTTVVQFSGNRLGKIVKASPSELEVIVPEGAQDGPLRVRVGKTAIAISEREFSLIPSPPAISSLSPSQGPVGSSLAIIGTHLSNSLQISDSLNDREEVKVLFGNLQAELDSVYSKRLWLKVPEGLPEGEVEVQVERDGLFSNSAIFNVGNPPIEDGFERIATEWTTNDGESSNPVGDFWQVLRGEWRINDPNSDGASNNHVEARATNAENLLMINTAAETFSGSKGSFSVSADIHVPSMDNSVLAGIAFHVQDVNNYYAFRLGGGGMIQLIRVVEGVPGGVFTDDVTFADRLKGNNTYRLEVSSDVEFSFNLKILTVNGELIAEGTFVDDQENFNGGMAGFYTNAAGLFDNFALITEE